MRNAMFSGLGGVLLTLASPGMAQGPALPDGPGKDQIAQACSACHSITQVTSQHHAKAQWADLVDQMIARGAQVSDADYPIVVDYLGTHFGLASAAGAGAAKP